MSMQAVIMLRRALLALGLALALAHVAGTARAAVAVANVSSAADDATSLTFSHTIASGTDRILIVGVAVDASSTTVSSVTYGGTGLTQIGTINGATRVYLYRMLAPSVGTANVVVILSGDDGLSVGAISFTGVDQTTPHGSFASNSGTSATPSVSLTSAPGELVVDIVATKSSTATANPGVGQTQQWNRYLSSNYSGAQSTKEGASPVTMSWSNAASSGWTIGAVSLKPSTPTFSISGTVFEDVNYGGGSGRTRVASSGVVRSGARVELYNAAGTFVTSTTTDGAGSYSFTGLASGNYTVRVVSSTVTSSRTGYVGGLLPVQTFRTSGLTGTVGTADPNRVGGETPNLADAGNGSTTLAALTTGSTTAQSITPVTLGASSVTGIDFGFNFDTIVNVNNAGQGSLRQFITNANTLGNGGLAQVGQTAGKEVSIFMISNGTAVSGLRAGLSNQLTSGVARINLSSALPAITGADTVIDGSTQTTNVGNTNAVTLGTGGTVGADNLALPQVAGPEVELRNAASLQNGLLVQAASVTVRHLSILGFGAANGDAAIRIVSGGTGALVENNALGTLTTSFADPGASLRNYESVDADGVTGGTIRNNLLTFTARRGIFLQNGATGWTVIGNEIRDSGLGDSDGDGISVNNGSGTFTGNLVVGSSSQGIALTTSTGNVLTNNTFAGNGVGTTSTGGMQSPAVTVRSSGSNSTFDRNVFSANYGAGIQVNNGASGVTMTRNSFFDNGTVTARNGGGATGQIGIDLNSASDNTNFGTAPFYTPNDNGDGDSGGNGLRNFPVIATAGISGSNLVLTGFARPGSVIEIFISDGDPSGFGEGKTYLTTLTEGSVDDTDNTTGTYTNPVNGLNQGTDNTNKFTFSIPVPGGVSAGTKLTATATLSIETSEFSGVATVSNILSISGKVFEDVNYGGKAGRTFTASGGSGRGGATVELYNASGNFVTSTVTDASGNYTFTGVTAGNNTIRVVNSTVTSSRAGYVPGLLPVQTFRTSGLTGTVGTADSDRVGGENPAVTAAGAGGPGTTMNTATGVFIAGISGQAQSITTVSVAAASVTGIDFGFNFDTVVNVNNSGQGSLRQFITNANALGGDGALAQSGSTISLTGFTTALPSARENSIFMIPGGTAVPGLRAGLASQLTAGVAAINLTSALPALAGANAAGTIIDGFTQTANVGDTNAGQGGNPDIAGKSVGTGADGVAGNGDDPQLPAYYKPEVEINGANTGASILQIGASNVVTQGLAIYNAGGANPSTASAVVVTGGTGSTVQRNFIGVRASGADPGAGNRVDNGVDVGLGAANVLNNFIAYTEDIAIDINNTSIVQGNDIYSVSTLSPNDDGITVEGTAGQAISLLENRIDKAPGYGIESFEAAGPFTISDNSITRTGTGGTETGGIRIYGSGSTITHNVLTTAAGPGISVVKGTGPTLQNTISQNSIFANGGLGIDIDVTNFAPANPNGDGVTLNDGAVNAGLPNGALDYPILATASISAGNLIVTGFARPGAIVELFIAAPDPTGFGEGQTYLVTRTEGSGDDTDSGTGTYTNPVNGFNQGTDTTNRFTFSITVPGGVSNGTVLTSTATLGNATSEFSGNVTVQDILTISGRVFEDFNYGGGAGRNRTAAGGSGRENARVELYNAADNFVSATTTDVNGDYAFTGLTAGDYTIRVVNSSVTSSRTGYVSTLRPVQIFRTDASTGTAVDKTDYVGGETPNLVDAGDGSTTLAALTTATTTAQSVTPVTVATASVTGVDFGFSFNAVVNVNNTGQGSLRQSITNANALSNTGLAQSGLVAGKDNAVFMISNGTTAAGLRAANNYFSGGVATISPTSALDPITDPIVIDAQKQPGWTATPLVELTGAGAGAGVTGLSISAGSSVVRGLVVNSFLHSGIALSGSGGNVIQGNYLGTNAAGTAAAQNDQQGLYIDGSPNNTIGGTTAAERNVISGNRLRGIYILGAGATNNTVTGNYIGLNVAGTAAVPSAIGLYINGAGSNTIGGSAAGAGNVISGNTQIGLYFVAAGATGNLVRGNVIGLAAAASAAVPNGTRGIEFVTTASNNTIGGSGAGEGNIIAGNIGGGVRVITGTGNRLQRNSIYGNTGPGIDLGLDNVTANDGATGSGPNNGMDYPVFTSATLSGGNLTVTGYVGNAPGQAAFANAVLEIFKADNTPADQNGEIVAGDAQSVAHGEGRTYLEEITADASGNFSATFAAAGLSIGESITATATNAGNDTSEFGANFVVTVPGVAVSGTVYADPNHNAQLDGSEAGTGLTLYAKLIPAGTPAGPATQAVAIDSSTGLYTLSGVAVGTYIIVIDDNNTLADVTPTIPADWIGTEQPTQIRGNVVVTGTPSPNQNFGLFNGSRIAGTVFADTGAGGGTANDGIRNGTETGLANVTVRLTDNAGSTTLDQTVTGGAGQYVLWAPAPAAVVKVVEVNPPSHLSTGADIGTSGGTYDRGTDTLTFTHTPGTVYTGLDFGDVPANIFTTDGQQAGQPGTTVVYAHTFTAGSAGSVTFSTVSTPDPSTVTTWSNVLHEDTNGNGQLDAGEPVLSGPVAVTAGQTIHLLVKEYIPADAPFNAQDPITVTAAFTWTAAAPVLGASLTRTDLTTVGEAATAGLALLKSVDVGTALPGDTVTYTIAYTNNSSDALRDVIIHDTTPAFTTFVSASNSALPADLTGIVIADPGVGSEGAISWTFTGTLAPAATGTVTFAVKIAE